MKGMKIVLSMIVASILLVACNKNTPIGDYDVADVGKIKKVVPGTIISMRPVRLHNHDNAADISSGTSSDHVDADNSYNRSHGYEYVIRLNSGSIISLVQAENLKLKNKQHILVIYGANTRIVADNGQDDY